MDSQERAESWLLQAKNDLEWGEASCRSDFFAQACFIAQQTSEKALKALAYFKGYDIVKGHSVKVVAEKLGFDGDVTEAAKILDQYYISTRYPDAFPAGAPFQFFTREQAETALKLAESIIKKVEDAIASSGNE